MHTRDRKGVYASIMGKITLRRTRRILTSSLPQAAQRGCGHFPSPVSLALLERGRASFLGEARWARFPPFPVERLTFLFLPQSEAVPGGRAGLGPPSSQEQDAECRRGWM